MQMKICWRKTLALVMAILMLVTVLPSGAFAAGNETSGRSLGPDLTKGNLNDLLTFFNSPGYADDQVRYVGLEYSNTKDNLIKLNHTRWFRGSIRLNNNERRPDHDDYFLGTYVIRFQDPDFYKNISSIQIGGKPFAAYNFGNNNELNRSTWVIKVRDIPLSGQIGSVVNDNVEITLTQGTSLQSLNLVDKKLYYDQLIINDNRKIEFNSVSNGYILANQDNSSQYTSGFLTGAGTNKAILDLTPGKEALKVVYTFKPNENFLQTNYSWVVYPKAILPKELMPLLDTDIVTIYNSESNGDRTARQEFSVAVSEKNKEDGVITTRGTRDLSIHKDAGYAYTDPTTKKKVEEGRTPLYLTNLNNARTNIDRIFFGVLGQSRSFTFRIPLKKTTTNKDFIEKMKEIAEKNGGKIPLMTEMEADWPDFFMKASRAPGYPDEGVEPPVINNSVSASYINFIDSDNDGLPDMTELNMGTDPAKPDSDNDGLSDGQEVIYDATDPLDPRNYKPGAPRADEDSKIIEVDKEVTIKGALDDYVSKITDGKNNETSLTPTDSKAAPVKVFIAKYVDNNGTPDYDRSRVYGSTNIPLGELAKDRKFTLTISANQLPQNFDYVLVVESPDGKVKVVGDKIQTKGIMLHANNGTDKTINIPVATDGGKTQLPDCSQEFKNDDKQLVGFAYDKDATTPSYIGKLFIGNATQVDASKLEHKDLYAVYKDKITVTVTKTWKDAEGKEITPAPKHKVKVGLMFRTAVGAPHKEIIHDPLAAYFPVKGTIQELKNGQATWKLPGYDKFGNRLSYIAAEVKDGEGEDEKFYNFDPGKGTWADLDIKLYETEFTIPGDINSGIAKLGYKLQFAQFKTGNQIDAYSSATTRKINVAPEGQGNFFTSYEISMTNTKINVAPPRIVQGYENETEVKVVAPNDDSVTKMTVQIGDKTPITLEKDPADGIFKSKDAGVQVTPPKDGSKEYKIKTDPLVKDTKVTATSFGKDNAQAVDTMTVRERVPSGIPTDVKQGKHEKDGEKTNAVVTAVPGTISGDKVPAGTTYELVVNDGSGNYVSVDTPIMGTVGPDGKIKFLIPEGTLDHDTELKIRQKSPEQKPSDSEAIKLDLKAPVIEAGDITGFVGVEVKDYKVTTDEPARLSIAKGAIPEGFSYITGTNDPKYQLPKEWTLTGAATDVANEKITLQAEDAFGNTATKEIQVTIKPRIIKNPKGEKEEGYARVIFVADENKARLDGVTVYDIYVDNENPVQVRELDKPHVILNDEAKYNFNYGNGWKLKEASGLKDLTGREDITADMTIEAKITTNDPVVGETTVNQNGTVEAKDFVKNKDNLPAGTEYEFVGNPPSTANIDTLDVKIKVTKPGEAPQEFTTKLHVTANIVPGTGKDKPAGYYTVEFVDGGHGKFAEGQETKYYVKPNAGVKMGDIKAPTVIPETGYTFASWSKEYKADEEIKGDKQVTAVYNYKKAVSTEKVEGWAEVTLLSGDHGKFTRTYTKDGQTVTDYNETLTYWVDPARVATIPSPTVEAKTGWTFTGFDQSLTGLFADKTVINAMYLSSKDIIPDDTPDNDKDDNEQKPKGYVTVKFEAGTNGKFAANQVTKYFVNPKKDVPIGAPAIDANEGYIFDKYTDANGVEHSSDAKKYEKDTIFTAQYITAGDISDKPVKGYVEIKFVAGDHTSFEGKTEKEISYYVNPKANKKLSELLTGKFAEPTLVYNAGYKQGTTKWTPDLDLNATVTEAKTYTANAVAKANITTDENKPVPKGFVRLTFTTDDTKGTFTAKLDGADKETTGIKKLFVDVKPFETTLKEATAGIKVVTADGVASKGWTQDGSKKLEDYYPIRTAETIQALYGAIPATPELVQPRAGDEAVKVKNPLKVEGQENVDKITVTVTTKDESTQKPVSKEVVAEKQADGTWKVNGQEVTTDGDKLVIPVQKLKNKDTVEAFVTDKENNDSKKVSVTVGIDTTELEKSIEKADEIIKTDGDKFKPDTSPVDEALKKALEDGKGVKKKVDDNDKDIDQGKVDDAKKALDKAIAQKEADTAVDNAKDTVLNPNANDAEKNNAINDAQNKINDIPGSTDPNASDHNPIKKELQDKLDLIKKIKEGEDRLKKDDVTGKEGVPQKPSDLINDLKKAVKEGKDALKPENKDKIPGSKDKIDIALKNIDKEQVVLSVEQPTGGSNQLVVTTLQVDVQLKVYINGKMQMENTKLKTNALGKAIINMDKDFVTGDNVKVVGSKEGLIDSEVTVNPK